MSTRGHQSDYDPLGTARCERALVTLLGDVGQPWRERIFLVGGLAPRYLVGALPEEAAPHIGTTDVDLVIGIAVSPDAEEAYRTLHTNLVRSGFHQTEPSFAWTRTVDGASVKVEFMSETDTVEQGRIFRPGSGTGSGLAAFNVRGALLASRDFITVTLARERLDNGGISRVDLRVANILPYTVLKINAFNDRHENKDAYDLVFTLLHADGGPEAAGFRAATSPIADDPQVTSAVELLAERFSTPDMDGPRAYGAFLAFDLESPGDSPGDYYEDLEEQAARYQQEAVATVRAFLLGLSRR